MSTDVPQNTRTGSASRDLPKLTEGVVRAVDGASRGRSVKVTSDRAIVLGHADDCDLQLSDDRVSRRHCEVLIGSRGFIVRDLDSRNGTFFEGSRIKEAAVSPGAILRLGDTHVVIAAAGDTERISPLDAHSFGSLVGRSLAMRRTFSLLQAASRSDITVLLGGETGSGKDGAARAIHDESDRRAQPFEVLDCGAVAADLLPSELFGHVRGAFTGANQQRIGVFERAHGGTVFLDEIGELPLALQPTLLRICDHGAVTRVGSAESRAVDVRIIAATRRDLAEEVLAGRFRQDLFYRLQAFPIYLPPLRARKDDLAPLCDRLLRELGMKDPGPIEGEPLARLMESRWPGNVRQLRNVLERAMVDVGVGGRFSELSLTMDEDVAPATVATDDSFQSLKQQAVNTFESQFLAKLMRDHQGNVKQASRASGIERTQLKRLLRKHGLL